MLPSTPSKKSQPQRRSLRLMKTSAEKAVAAAKADSSSSSSSSPPRRNKRKSSINYVTNTKKKRRSTDEDSFIKKPKATNAVTPNTAVSRESDFEKEMTQKLEERMRFFTPDRPKNVVELYPSKWKLCACDVNHCSCLSQSHVYIHQYGREYLQFLKDWDRAFLTSSPYASESSSTGDDADSSSQRFTSRVSLTPPGRVNYAVNSGIEDNSSVESTSTVPQRLPNQPHLTRKMRAVLVDWLIELSEEYTISAKTLHLSVALLDRALECGGLRDSERELIITRDMFQCLGCACMWMAAKMEEITSPTVNDFSYISADSYTKKDITEMEMRVCCSLEFRLWQVTPYHFVDELLRASSSGCHNSHLKCPVVDSSIERSMVLYMLELGMLLYEFVITSPRKVAAAAMYLTRVVLGIENGAWTPTLEHYSGFSKWDLEDAVLRLHKQHSASEESKLDNAFTKYSKDKHHNVALKTVPLRQDLGF